MFTDIFVLLVVFVAFQAFFLSSTIFSQPYSSVDYPRVSGSDADSSPSDSFIFPILFLIVRLYGYSRESLL